MTQWASVLVAGLFFVFCLFSPVSAQLPVIYVNQSSTNDGPDCGDASNPCQTLERGIGLVAPRGTIFLTSGNFDLPQIEVAKPIFISGDKFGTVLMCNASTEFGLKSSDTLNITGVTFQNCKIAVLLDGGSNSQINDCIFSANQYGLMALSTPDLVINGSKFQDNTNGSLIVRGMGGANTIVVTKTDFTGNNGINGAAASLTAQSQEYNFTECTFENNIATNWGGAIYLANFSVLNLMDGSSAYQNHAMKGGALHVNDNSRAVIDHTNFDSNDALAGSDGTGGHIFVHSGCGVQLTNSLLTRGKASYEGGAIYAEGTFSASYSNFTANTTPTSPGGGAVFMFGLLQSLAKIDNCIFANNIASGAGGVLSSYYSDVIFSSCEFHSNEAQNGGVAESAGFGPTQLSTITFTDCYVGNNSASANAGALNLLNVRLIISGSKYWENNKANEAGAIYLTSSAAQITGITFYNNTATQNIGGAILGLTSSQVHATGVTFRAHSVSVQLQTAPASSFVNCIFDSNVGAGSAIFLATSNCSINGSTFIHNGVNSPDNLKGPTIQSSASSLFIYNSTFVNNMGVNGGAVYFVAESTVQIIATNFRNNIAVEGILHGINSSLTATACNFQQNSVSHGSAACLFYSTATFDSSNFTYNTADVGSVIFAPGPGSVQITVNKCIFSGNSNTQADGAAMLVFNATLLQVTNSVFSFNSAPNGGALFVSRSHLAASSNTFRGNSANFGSAIYLATADASLTDVNFSENIANASGALMIDSNSSATVSESTFSMNQAISGAGIYSAGNLTVTAPNCQFTSNNASYGSAIFSKGPSTTIYSANFTLNTAITSGGAIYTTPGDLTIISAMFSANSAQLGGALFTSFSNAYLDNAYFSSNSAQSGGAIYSHDSTWSAVGGAISLNHATKGGGIFAVQGNVHLQHIEMNKNSASDGAALYFTQSAVLNITDCFINHNTASSRGGGIAVFDAVSGGISDTNFLANSAKQGGNVYLESGISITSSSITQGISIKGMGDGIYLNSSAAERGLRVTNTNITNSSPYVFCCGNTPLSEINSTICSYPSCSKDCGRSDDVSCTCPDLPANFSCVCTDPIYAGAFCNIPDKCLSDPGYCLNGTCSYDSLSYISNCSDKDNCIGVTCPVGQYCIDLLFHYICSPCPPGQVYFGGACIDACLVHNGDCDFHVSCTTGPVCGPCPVGYGGDGVSGCVALCGNGTCDAAIGEDCVSCPMDCYNRTSCGVCGDHFCQMQKNETCSSCHEDCGLCAPTPCIPADCSKHGTCNAGLCVCNNPWGGPACDKDNSPIDLNFTTGGGVQVGSGNLAVSFLLTIASIVEQDIQGRPVDSLNITNKNYTFSLFNNTDQPTNTSDFGACSDCDLPFYVQTVSSSGNLNKLYRYNVTLENGAYLEFMIWQFLDASTTMSFANETTQYFANSFKLALQLRNWPFKNLKNTLAIVLDAKASEEKACSAVHSNQDENNNLKWYTLNVKGVTLYGQFLNRAIVDGLFRSVTFSLNPDRSVTATLPHFWENLVLDPSFSVLVGSEDASCGKSSKVNKKLIEILVPILVVVTVAVVVFIIMYPKLKSLAKVRRGRQQLQQTDPEQNANIEMIKSYQVNSSAGNFSVQL